MSNFHKLEFYKMYKMTGTPIVLSFEDSISGEDMHFEIDKSGRTTRRKYYSDGDFAGLQPVNLYDELVKLLNRLEEQE